jgi:hypothetical protein
VESPLQSLLKGHLEHEEILVSRSDSGGDNYHHPSKKNATKSMAPLETPMLNDWRHCALDTKGG